MSGLRGSPTNLKIMQPGNRLLTIKELAEYLGVPVATLYQWRYRREGPRGVSCGPTHPLSVE